MRLGTRLPRRAMQRGFRKGSGEEKKLFVRNCRKRLFLRARNVPSFYGEEASRSETIDGASEQVRESDIATLSDYGRKGRRRRERPLRSIPPPPLPPPKIAFPIHVSESHCIESHERERERVPASFPPGDPEEAQVTSINSTANECLLQAISMSGQI